MRLYNRKKTIILVVLGLGFVLVPTVAYIVNLEIGYSVKISEYRENITLDKESLRISKASGKIHIKYNWTDAKSALICTGNGTYSEPYIIEDLVIDAGGSGSCIWVENSYVYFRIENCTLSNSGSSYPNAGIRLDNVANGRLIDNNCSSNNNGIYFDSCYDNTISGNNVSNNRNFGIDLRYSSDYNRITGNTVNENNGDGIRLYECNDNIVKNNTINYNNRGVYIYYSDDITVTGNQINHNDEYGIYLSSNEHNTISGNNINHNDGHGIYFYQADNNNITGNVINNNTGNGIHFYYSYSTVIC